LYIVLAYLLYIEKMNFGRKIGRSFLKAAKNTERMRRTAKRNLGEVKDLGFNKAGKGVTSAFSMGGGVVEPMDGIGSPFEENTGFEQSSEKRRGSKDIIDVLMEEDIDARR